MYSNLIDIYYNYRELISAKSAKVLYLSKIFSISSSSMYNAVITIFLLSKGVSFPEIGILWSLTLTCSTLMDFPTGAFSDKYGRIKIYSLGMITIGIGRLFYANGNLFILFLPAAILLGVGEALMSSAMSSWVVDKINESGSKKMISLIFGKSQAIGSVAGVLAGIIVGLFFNKALVFALLVGGFINIAGALFLLLSVKDNYGLKTRKWGKLSYDSLKLFFGSKTLIILVALQFFAFTGYSVFLFAWQPLARNLSIDVGYFYSLYMLISGFSGYLAGKIVSKFSNKKKLSVFLSLMLISSGLILMPFTNRITYILGFAMYSFGYGSFFPIYISWSQQLIPSSIRSSVTSLMSTISSSFLIIEQMVLGWAFGRFHFSVMIVSGLLLLLLSIVVLSFAHEKAGEHI